MAKVRLYNHRPEDEDIHLVFASENVVELEQHLKQRPEARTYVAEVYYRQEASPAWVGMAYDAPAMMKSLT